MRNTYLKKLLKSSLARFDLAITKKSFIDKMTSDSEVNHKIQFLKTLPDETVLDALKWIDRSHSQHMQDLFVLAECGFKTRGFFVEFGATDGVEISNSFLLEKEFAWNGILAEPARIWHNELRKNRLASIEMNCVWSTSGEILSFVQANRPVLSTLEQFSDSDSHAADRDDGDSYSVKTISLNDLLVKHQAPRKIDYLSIDTEGSEFEILSAFDFETYDVGIITVEHNHSIMREHLYDLLTKQGYRRKMENVSMCDDWYVKETV